MRISRFIADFHAQQPRIQTPLIIAEAGVNHEGSMDTAKRLIDEAAEGGADAIKFQTYKAHTLACKESPAYWDTTKEPTKSQFELFKKHDRFWKEEFEELRTYCDRAGIEFLSTPFDLESATFLNDLMEVFKISSSDITNKPFIEYICGFDKPILLSTGASHMYEIEEAVSWVEGFGNPLVLLHCVLNYPTPNHCANLGMIVHLQEKFPFNPIGYSDHTLPEDMKTLEVAVMLGAQILEKHFTYDKTQPGNDHYHAMDMNDLKALRSNLDRLFSLLGTFRKGPLETESLSRENARRSLVAARDIPAGKTIGQSDLTWKRPACGISPRHWNDVIGKRAAVFLREDRILKWSDLEG